MQEGNSVSERGADDTRYQWILLGLGSIIKLIPKQSNGTRSSTFETKWACKFNTVLFRYFLAAADLDVDFCCCCRCWTFPLINHLKFDFYQSYYYYFDTVLNFNTAHLPSHRSFSLEGTSGNARCPCHIALQKPFRYYQFAISEYKKSTFLQLWTS